MSAEEEASQEASQLLEKIHRAYLINPTGKPIELIFGSNESGLFSILEKIKIIKINKTIKKADGLFAGIIEIKQPIFNSFIKDWKEIEGHSLYSKYERAKLLINLLHTGKKGAKPLPATTIESVKELVRMSEREKIKKEILQEKNKGKTLTCSGLTFDKNTGDAYYDGVKTNFKPEKDEYKVLKVLMEKPNERLSYDQINIALGKNENSKKDRGDLSTIIRNIRKKLGIGTKGKKGNKNLFEASNGYRIVC